jgi:hypothetical protein
MSPMMMSDPDPTEVKPTTMPPSAPSTIVGTIRRVTVGRPCGSGSPGSSRRRARSTRLR